MDLQKIIRRRKATKRRKDKECASGAAFAKASTTINYNECNWFCNEDTMEYVQSDAAHPADAIPPRVIYSQNVKRPIHIEPTSHVSTDSWPRRAAPTPQDPGKIADAIASAYHLTREQVVEMVDALTNARLLLGYKHPVLRKSNHPFSAA